MRAALKLLVLLITVQVALVFNGSRFHKPVSTSEIAGITEPGLAMEFASSQEQVKTLLDDSDPKNQNRQVLKWQQWIDFLYIALYWAFFFYVVGGPMRGERSALPLLGQIVGALITVAALCDVLEDVGILLALRSTYSGTFWPFEFALAKWFCFYLVLLIAAVFFVRYPRLGAFPMPASRLDLLGIVTGILLAASSVTGLIGTLSVAGMIPDKAPWVAYAFLPLLGTIVFLLVWFIAGVVMQPTRSVRASQG